MDNYIFILVIILIVSLYSYYEYTRGTNPYRGRKCMGKAWKKAFPEAKKENIRLFLECLVDGMCFSSKIKLKFHPNDQVIDIYRSIYFGRTPIGDQMECETFLENLADSFSIEYETLLKIWDEEITLGDLYKYVTT